MKDRIKQFMDYKGITAGDLASALDVQRSNISHILNGRNKPGANFIEKLLLAYSDLDARWLLTGNGNMLHENTPKDSSDSSNNLNAYSNKKAFDNATDETTKSIIKSKTEHHLSRIHENEKIVEKIILLYSDGSFKSYNPENK